MVTKEKIRLCEEKMKQNREEGVSNTYKSRRIVVLDGLGISERFQNWIGL